MKVIIACRLSRLHDGSTGLDTQEREVIRWAEDQGHEVVAVVQDAKSGAKAIMSRHKLAPWLTDKTKLAQYEGIVVLRMDRLTRGDSAETRRIETWADDNGKTLMTSDGLVFPCEGADGIRWDLAKRLAHDEWLRIKQRYGDMQASVRSRGGYIGKTPFGMRLEKNDQGAKALAPDPARWPIVVQAFERVPTLRLKALSAWLSKQTGQPWAERAVLAMLRNGVYRSVPGFERAQVVLDSRAAQGRSANGEKALLSALKCGDPECDATGPKPSPMYRLRSRDGLFYRCAGLGVRRSGCGNMVSLEALDALVLGGLEIWETEPYIERAWVAGNDVSEAVQALKDRLPYAKTRRDSEALWDEIDALELKGSTPGRWAEKDSGKSIGYYLDRATLAEQRTFFAGRDIRAWHIGREILVLVDGHLARKGGPSAISGV